MKILKNNYEKIFQIKKVLVYGKQYLKILKTELLFNPSPEHISRENSNLERYSLPSVHCISIHNNQDMETT